jgi:Zn-dependent protease with chaperone function
MALPMRSISDWVSDAPAAGSSWTGDFTDGRSASLRAVQVEFDGAQLLVYDKSDRSRIAQWALSDVSLDAIQERDVVHLQNTADPEALITFYGREARDGLSRIGIRSDALPRNQWHRLILIVVCVAGIAGMVTLIWNTIPIISRAIADRIPLEIERGLGVQFEEQFSDRYCESKAAGVVLANLTMKLAGSSNPISAVHVMDIEIPNAFAFPGGYVVLTRGLIESAESPDEIAGVLAHEIAHVYERHVMARIVRSALLSTLWAVTVGDFSGLMVIDPSTVFQIATLQFSREDEAEADRGAVEMLIQADIRRDGFVVFFERMSENEGDIPEWLSTHPASGNRAEIAASELESGTDTRPAMTDEAWETLLAVCSADPEPQSAFSEILLD